MGNNFNGWTNYETWITNLWIDNDRAEYEYMRECAREALTDTDGDENEAIDQLSETIRTYMDDNAPETTGVYADLLGAAMGEINYYEIAQHIVADVYDDWLEENETDDEDEME